VAYTDAIASIQASINALPLTDPNIAACTAACTALGTSLGAGIASSLTNAQNYMAQAGAASAITGQIEGCNLCQIAMSLLQHAGALDGGSVLNQLEQNCHVALTGSAIASLLAEYQALVNAAGAAMGVAVTALDSAMQAWGLAASIMRNPCSVLNEINILGSLVDSNVAALAHARDAVNGVVDATGNMILNPDAMNSIGLSISTSLNLCGNSQNYGAAVTAIM
jgi:hypothetical protein